MSRSAVCVGFLVAVGCGGTGGGDRPDAGAAGPILDAALPDATALPLAGFGALSGDCDLLDDELDSAEPSLFESAIDFAVPFTDDQAAQLSDGGQVILAEGNAGGSSLYSEIFAFELLARCELAPLLKTETAIDYDQPGAITDLLVAVDGEKIGVSVTRAVAFPFEDPYTAEQARELLERKLGDILESTAHVSAADRWQKQILLILAYGPAHADAVRDAIAGIDEATRADTIVWTLVTDGADDFVYCDGPCDG